MKADFKNLYKQCLRIRLVEEKIVDLYPSDKIQSPVHLSIGQESVAVGLCNALEDDDKVFQTYRSHAIYLAKGGCIKKMFAELYGKVDGISNGKAGSMHLISKDRGVSASSAIVSSTIPHALGSAFVMKKSKKKNISVAFFGDGACEEGVYHESLNLASVKKLPVLFFCENNGLAIQSKITSRQSFDILKHAQSYGIETLHIKNGWDFLEIKKQVMLAKKKIINDSKPFFILVDTLRFFEHVGIQKETLKVQHTRKNNSKWWYGKDVINKHENLKEELKSSIMNEINKAIKYAEESKFPKKSDLFSNLTTPLNSKKKLKKDILTTKKIISFRDSIFLTIKKQMKKNKNIVVFGQGVDDKNGTFGTTKNLNKLFGDDRCFDTPIAEESLCGFALGLSISNFYPINIHIRNDFLLLAFNQIVNLISKFEYMFGGIYKTPLLIRAIIGRSWGQGAQHSQSIQSMLSHNPGITVIMPSSAQSIFESYSYAITNYRGPVISLEHRVLYDLKFRIGATKSLNPFKPKLIKKGKDLTIIATSIMVWESMRAIKIIEKNFSLSIELIDLHCISKCDQSLLLKSIKKTKKVIIVDTSWKEFGVASEISRLICENIPDLLKKPVVSICNQSTPCPTSKSLENYFYPSVQEICKNILKICTVEKKKDVILKKYLHTTEYFRQFRGPF